MYLGLVVFMLQDLFFTSQMYPVFAYNHYYPTSIPPQHKTLVKVIHVHHDLRKMFITLNQQFFLPSPFSYNYPSCSILCIMHCVIIELLYNQVLSYNSPYYITYIKLLHPNFEIIVNVNRL